LGAAGLGDIGEWFPDTENKYKGISSRKIIKKVYALVKKNGYCINNIDTIVIAQKPNLTQIKPRIRKSIAQILNIDKEKINIKAKTQEGLGRLGKNKAIAAYAAVCLKK